MELWEQLDAVHLIISTRSDQSVSEFKTTMVSLKVLVNPLFYESSCNTPTITKFINNMKTNFVTAKYFLCCFFGNFLPLPIKETTPLKASSLVMML